VKPHRGPPCKRRHPPLREHRPLRQHRDSRHRLAPRHPGLCVPHYLKRHSCWHPISRMGPLHLGRDCSTGLASGYTGRPHGSGEIAGWVGGLGLGWSRKVSYKHGVVWPSFRSMVGMHLALFWTLLLYNQAEDRQQAFKFGRFVKPPEKCHSKHKRRCQPWSLTTGLGRVRHFILANIRSLPWQEPVPFSHCFMQVYPVVLRLTRPFLPHVSLFATTVWRTLEIWMPASRTQRTHLTSTNLPDHDNQPLGNLSAPAPVWSH
jgi:hypothetical protein